MATTIEWQGHKIEMNVYLSGKYVFLAGESTVRVDGQEVARSGGFNFTESAIGTFQHDGKPTRVELEVQGGLFTLANINYVLRIEGAPVSHGKLSFERIGTGCLVWGLVLVVIAALALSWLLPKLL